MLKFLILTFACISIVYSKHSRINQEKFAKDALIAHNIYRKIHGVDPLVLNSNLSKLAFKRAEELAWVGELNVKQNFYDGINLGETVGSVAGFIEYNGNNFKLF